MHSTDTVGDLVLLQELLDGHVGSVDLRTGMVHSCGGYGSLTSVHSNIQAMQAGQMKAIWATAMLGI